MARPAASMKRPAAAEPLDLSSPPRKATATEVPTNPDSMGFKCGPRKLEELLSWADEAVAYILADPGSIWLQNLTERGVCIGSHFSGLMTAEVALEQLVRATKAQMPEIDVRGKLIDAWTCDTAAPRRIGQRLVFSNILDAFSDGARQHVDKYHKHRQSGMEASKEALDTLQTYVLARPAEALGSAKCWRTHQYCRREDCSVISHVCS